MRIGISRTALAAALMGLAFTAPQAAPVAAQGVNLTLVGETAGDDVSLYLAEGTWAAGGIGIAPVASLQTYLVTFDAGSNGTGSTWSVTPAAGLRYGMGDGFLQGTVGYSFKGDNDVVALTPNVGATRFFGGAEDGVNVTGHAQWWGTGAFGLQGIASHNFGSDYLWTRGRGTVRLNESASGDLHAGAEAGWQGELGEESAVAPNYSAVMAGPVVQWATENVSALVGAGWKGIDTETAPEGEDSTWYMKVELVLTPHW